MVTKKLLEERFGRFVYTTYWFPPTNEKHIKIVEQHCNQLFAEILALAELPRTADNAQTILNYTAECEWFSAQSWKYAPGCAGIAQLKTRATLDFAGIHNGRYKENLDPNLEALVMPLEEFVQNFSSFFESPPSVSL